MQNRRKKLIEVAIPLDVINQASDRDKTLRKGHPGSLHLWWAPRPLPAARAVLFAQFVDDPSSVPEEFPTVKEQDKERKRLFQILGRILLWENCTDERILNEARFEIARSMARSSEAAWASFSESLQGDRLLQFLSQHAPAVLDPFAGGGRIPLEARRLGLTTVARDINPFPVLINRAHVDYLNRETLSRANVRRLEALLRDAMALGGYYQLERDGERIVVDGYYCVWMGRCDSPGCRRILPLKNGIALGNGSYLTIRNENGIHVEFSKTPFEHVGDVDCPACGHAHRFADVRRMARKAGLQDTAVAAIIKKGAKKSWIPGPFNLPSPNGFQLDGEIPEKALGIRVRNYGLTHYWQLYNGRMRAVIGRAIQTLKKLDTSDRVVAWLILIRVLDYYNILTFLDPRSGSVQKATGPPTMQMRLGYCEINPLGSWSGNLDDASKRLLDVDFRHFGGTGVVEQGLAQDLEADGFVLSTDPPYYDMIGYAALSDQFYIWARELFAGSDLQEHFATLLTPKTGELIADPGRHGSAKEAAQFFQGGMAQVLARAKATSNHQVPATIYYSYKQKEYGPTGNAWEVMLESVIGQGWEITASWPIEAEMKGGLRVVNRNSLANCIVLVCRPRPDDAGVIDRAGFSRLLKATIPESIRNLRAAGMQSADLAQAAVGPGMSIYSAYSKVLNPDGGRMPIGDALEMIRQEIDEVLAEDLSALDSETSWAASWFQNHGYDPGPFGHAESLAKMKGVSVDGLAARGLVESKANKVVLVRCHMTKTSSTPVESGTAAWKVLHYMAAELENGSEEKCAAVLAHSKLPVGDLRALCDWLFTAAERRGMNKDAQVFNRLASSWFEIARLAQGGSGGQGSLEDF